MNNDFTPPAIVNIDSMNNGISLYGGLRPSNTGIQRMPGGGIPTMDDPEGQQIFISPNGDVTE